MVSAEERMGRAVKLAPMLKGDEDAVRVIFRTYKHGTFKGDVVALFPDEPEDGHLVTCYAHIGQHGSADYVGTIMQTRPSTPEESAPLKAELESIGYKLTVARRRTSWSKRKDG